MRDGRATEERAMRSVNNPRFFVTGGTGFIGSRLIEVLRDQLGANVTALAHRTSPGALRLAAAGVPLDLTPINDVEGLTKAIAGHDAVLHLAYGRSGTAQDMRRTTVDGTRALIDAALAAKVPRFVDVSTAAVYFGAPAGEIDEAAPRRKWGWSYSDEKLEAEDAVRAATATRGLQGSVFQVAGVYGPWGETFVVNPLRNMRRGVVVLPNFGKGVSNMTYVDDVVQALILGLQDRAVGETFIVKGPGRVTRLEAYRRLEDMLGYAAVEGVAAEEMAKRRGGDWAALARLPGAALRALLASAELKSVARETPLAPAARAAWRALGALRRGERRLAPAPSAEQTLPRIFPPDIMIDYLSAEVSFSCAKAERLLGYSPKIGLDDGMGLTREWAAWANLLGPRL
jgi:nucleoside-diphosphate-sugar epimerase